MAVLAAAVVAGAAPRPGADLLVTVGATTPSGAVLWTRAPAPGPVSARVHPEGSGGPPVEVVGMAGPAHDHTVHLVVEGLRAATRYRYEVRWRGHGVHGAFVTAPEAGDPAPVLVQWSGDLGGAGRCRVPGEGYPIFRAMADRRPDLFLFVGDTVYADVPCPAPPNVPGSDFRATTLAGYHRKHRYNRSDEAVQTLFRRTTVEAVWDDHEVTNDFAGPSEPRMPVGREAFLDYWPIRPPPEEPGRLYRRLRWGRRLELYLLDTRQYRSPNTAPDGPDKTMLGGGQLAWLLEGLAGSDAEWKVVVSSVTLSTPTGRPGRDGWARLDLPPVGGPSGFEHELGVILDALATRGVRNVVWLAADVHHAAVLRHEPRPGFAFHELVAGPLRAGLGRPGVLSPTLRPRRLFGDGGYDNFGELEATPGGLVVRIVDAAGTVRFETTLRPAPAAGG